MQYNTIHFIKCILPYGTVLYVPGFPYGRAGYVDMFGRITEVCNCHNKEM